MISVIITSFNQEEALRCSLPVFLSQTCCDYEVIVVDKNSEDLTVGYLEEMELSHKRLSHIVLPTSTKANNKDVMAMLLGIRHCVSQRVIIASAACVPHSEHLLDDVLAVWDMPCGSSPMAGLAALFRLYWASRGRCSSRAAG